eukprot:FR744083.1.p3 GENE.FR744083.1~~FR744083.1.p3  ORF type:complete len:101 (+),score=54.55 FR744083.1:815-1117(+)
MGLAEYLSELGTGKKKKKKKKSGPRGGQPRPRARGTTNSKAAAPAVEPPLFVPLRRVNLPPWRNPGANRFPGGKLFSPPQSPQKIKNRKNKKGKNPGGGP